MHCRLVATALAPLLVAGAVHAQSQAAVEPGGVVTVVASAAAEPGDTLAYGVAAVEGVRIFGRSFGEAVADDSGAIRIPVTLGLPAGALAGPMVVGAIAIGGGPDAERQVLRVQVAAHRDVTLRMGSDTLAVTPGEPAEVKFSVRNRGNATDTFAVSVSTPPGWITHSIPDRIPLPPGTTATGTIQVVPAQAAVPGGEHRVRIRLEAAGLARTDFVTLVVVSRGAWPGGLEQIPGSLFLGSSSTEASEPNVALRANGQVGSTTRMSLALRHSASLIPPTSFRGELSGPRIRLDLEGERWGAAVGDVFLTEDVFSGPIQQARGAEASVRHGSLEGEALVGTPWSYGPLDQSGHLARVSGAIETSAGRVGVQLSSVDRRASMLSGFQSLGGGLTYGVQTSHQQLSATAGIARVSDGSTARTGLAASARYRYQWDRGIVTSTLRTVPAATRLAASHDREAFVSALVDLLPRLSVTGFGFARSAPLVDGAPYGASRGGAGGFQLDLPRNARVDLSIRAHRSDVVGDTLEAALTRAVRTRLTVPVGRVTLEADLDVGSVKGLGDRKFRDMGLGVRWHESDHWATARISRYDNGLHAAEFRLDAAGAVEIRSARLHGGFSLPLEEALSRRLALWSGVEVPLNRDYDLLAGIDYAGTRAEPTRLSVGVRRQIGLPLPLRRQPVLEGVVFDDGNANRVRDPGEPVMPGIEMRLGALRVTTGADGRFEFFDEVRGPLRVLPASLPAGAVVPSDVYLPTTGSVQVPVIRTGTLAFELFIDRDGDGVMGEAEVSAAEATVSLTGPGDSVREGIADPRGRITFTGLEAGTYTVRIRRGVGVEPYEIQITLESGATVNRALPGPARRREIRTRDGPLREFPEHPGPEGLVVVSDSAPTIVLFEFDSTELDPDAAVLLRRCASTLRRDTSLTVLLLGHTDATGSEEYNQGLSHRRSDAIAAWLRGAGVAPHRIETRGFGETRPLATNATREGRRLNRRVEILLRRGPSRHATTS